MTGPADHEPSASATPVADRLFRPSQGGLPPVIWALLALSILPELVLMGADLGLWGPRNLRGLVLQYGAFWAGLLDNWPPNYPGQPVLMFLSYGFLHSGIWHMGLNMLTLVSLGRPLSAQLGQRKFLLLYIGSAIGGALAFAMFGPLAAPMVGASGALFGLAGALILDLWWETRQWRTLLLPTAGLIALNLIMYVAMNGLLAWQTHLGGFLAGVWVMGFYLIRAEAAEDTGGADSD